MEKSNKENTARKNIFVKSDEVNGINVKGYDFNDGVNYEKIFFHLASTGFQATNLARAIEIVNKMIASKKEFGAGSKIFLGYTSNMVSSGVRESIRYLVEHKKVDVCVTTGGGVEEDIIKCFDDFKIGKFELDGKSLREKGINRIGNILVPNSRYVKFEEWVMPVLKELHEKQKKSGKIATPSEIVWKLGEKINDKRSICYWAWKNKIKIYCPALMDGSLGDMIYFFRYQKGNEDFSVDIAEDTKELNDSTIGLKKSGVLILGAGVVKHSILNANLYRNGADYAVFINTAQEFDGSDAGARPDEAVSWGKLGVDGDSVKVFGDATILFPILMAESFANSA